MKDYHINRTHYGENLGDGMVDTRIAVRLNTPRIQSNMADQVQAMREVDSEIANRQFPRPPTLIETELDPKKVALMSFIEGSGGDFHSAKQPEHPVVPLSSHKLTRLRRQVSARKLARSK